MKNVADMKLVKRIIRKMSQPSCMSCGNDTTLIWAKRQGDSTLISGKVYCEGCEKVYPVIFAGFH